MTQNLSALRVSYAKLLDEHGTTTALLHQRELELEEARNETNEAAASLSKLREERDSIRDKSERHERRAELAERDAKFLRAMVVSGVGDPKSRSRECSHTMAELTPYYVLCLFVLHHPVGEIQRRGSLTGRHQR